MPEAGGWGLGNRSQGAPFLEKWVTGHVEVCSATRARCHLAKLRCGFVALRVWSVRPWTLPESTWRRSCMCRSFTSEARLPREDTACEVGLKHARSLLGQEKCSNLCVLCCPALSGS